MWKKRNVCRRSRLQVKVDDDALTWHGPLEFYLHKVTPEQLLRKGPEHRLSHYFKLSVFQFKISSLVVPVHGAFEGSLPALENWQVFSARAARVIGNLRSFLRLKHLVCSVKLFQFFSGLPETCRDIKKINLNIAITLRMCNTKGGEGLWTLRLNFFIYHVMMLVPDALEMNPLKHLIWINIQALAPPASGLFSSCIFDLIKPWLMYNNLIT